MAQKSSIEWTETTWNPVRGCTRISPGCEHCYAERLAHRFSGPGGPYEGLTRSSRKGPKWSGKVTVVDAAIEAPLRWQAPRVVFVNSMSDLFHKSIPFDAVERVFDVMARARQHTFQVLTKRADRLAALAPRLEWAPNVWMGVSVESPAYVDRIDFLRTVPAAVRFLSVEPLLAPMGTLDLDGIGWVIVGGESGPGARLMEPAWVREIRDQCVSSKVPFFFKQWGGVRKKSHGRKLDGGTWDQMPVADRDQGRASG
jgi:protein gp37